LCAWSHRQELLCTWSHRKEQTIKPNHEV
jgi:hypothetical protein